MTELDLKGLRKVAEGAMSGFWMVVLDGAHSGNKCIRKAYTMDFGDFERIVSANAAFIAAANPQAVLLLLDRIAELEGGLKALHSEGRALFAFKDDFRPIAGNTNIACFEHRLDEARSLLSTQTERA